MGPKDLDLEFEDESEEQERKRREAEEKKKRDSLHHNPDVEFSVPGMEGEASPKGTPASTPSPAQQAHKTQVKQPASVVSIEEKKKAAAQSTTQSIATHAPTAQAPQARAAAHAPMEYSSDRMYSATELHALIRAAVAESKLEMISELTSETKELEIKVSRLLTALAAKAPPLKKEFMQIQKLLQDHTKAPLKIAQSDDKKKAA